MNYEVGNTYESFINNQEGVKFDLTDEGAIMIIGFNNPDKEEIEDIKKGKLQFGMFVKDNIIFILSKFGSMPWMDAPYHVSLSKNLTSLGEVGENEGYSCNIFLTDIRTGRLDAMRLISFSTEYSRGLKNSIEDQMQENFDSGNYDAKIFNIITNYTTKQMVDMSIKNCRIR